jgi:triphosphoribosyl-dephospho-CoA synthetase
MDFDFIAKNISPGGCADLLAVTLLLDLLGRSRCF